MKNEQTTETTLKIRVLDDSELSVVSGGFLMEDQIGDGGCSCTRSVCHIDGVTDGD